MMKKCFLFFWILFVGFSMRLQAQSAISSAEDLRAMAMTGEYYLTTDLEVDEWTSPGVFRGTLDGRGYCITIKEASPDANGDIGLFASTEGATIANLVVGGNFRRFTGYGGSIVGHAVNTTIRDCETEAFLFTEDTEAVIGGLVGCLDGGCIVNSSSEATLEGLKLGGLAGSVVNDATIKNSYSNSGFVFSSKHNNPEVGFLVHDNEGLLENNYVTLQSRGWYIGSYGQQAMMMGVKGLCRNTDYPITWSYGFAASSTMYGTNRFLGFTEEGEVEVQNQNVFTGQTKLVKYVHDFHGSGYNLGDLICVSGVLCIVFYIHDDGCGGWAVPTVDNSFMRLMTSKTSNQLDGYYIPKRNIEALNCEYAQWHDGIVAHGGTAPLIPEGYDDNPGKFYTYTLQDNDDNPSTQVNRIKFDYSRFTANTRVKQLAYTNAGTIRNCYYPIPTTTYGLVNGTGVTDCCLFVEGEAPYNYGEFGPRLQQGNTVTELALADTLNAWVKAQEDATYEQWTVAGSNQINGNNPVHRFSFSNGMATVNTAVKNGRTKRHPALRYVALDGSTTMQTASGNTLAYYGNNEDVDADNVTEAWGSALFVTNEATMKGDYRLKGNVGVLLDNSDASAFAGEAYDWHMTSTVLADVPVGLYYAIYSPGGPFNEPSQVKFNKENGYFPLNTPYASWDFYCYDEPNDGWPNFKRSTGDHYHHDTGEPVDYANETNLIPGKGYLWAIDKKTGLQAYGTLNNGTVDRAVSHQGNFFQGYNLVGNPYQAHLDFDVFAEQNSTMLTQQAYTILDADRQGYVTYCPGASDNPIYASRYLHPHQGFFVQVNDDGQLRFDPGQTVVRADTYFRGDDYPLVNLIVEDGEGRKDYATVELDRPHDGGAAKMKGIHVCQGELAISHASEEYSIAFVEGRPGSVPVRFHPSADGHFVLRWDLRNEDFPYLHLVDHITGAEVDCLTESEYAFDASKDDYASRFKLVFSPTGIEESPQVDPQCFAYLSNETIVVEGQGQLELFDLQGRLLKLTNIDGYHNSMSVPDLAHGVYLLRLTSHNQTNIQKIIIP